MLSWLCSCLHTGNKVDRHWALCLHIVWVGVKVLVLEHTNRFHRSAQHSISCVFLLPIPSVGTLGLGLHSECSNTEDICSVQASGERTVLVPIEKWLGSEPPAASLGIQESLLPGDKAHVGRGGGTEVWLQEGKTE